MVIYLHVEMKKLQEFTHYFTQVESTPNTSQATNEVFGTWHPVTMRVLKL